jgi:2,4-dichlorophenol 6-monooxygenase
MLRSTPLKYDVAIVGAGPVGLFLSNLLKSYGVSHVLIDRKSSPVVHPQAHFFNSRSMELLQAHIPSAYAKMINIMAQSASWR